METKEFKVQIPEGYEIDRENSTFECIKFKLAKKYITYKDICKYIFNWRYYYTDSCGCIKCNTTINIENVNNSINVKQLERVLALNQLLNITTYYNNIAEELDGLYTIVYNTTTHMYEVISGPFEINFGLLAYFIRKEDAQSVIDNPNFQEILYTVYRR